MKRSRNSYIRSPRKVTFAPIAWSFRSLKLEMLFWPAFHRALARNQQAPPCLLSACFTSDCEPTEVLITTFSTLEPVNVLVAVPLLQRRHYPFLVIAIELRFHFSTKLF